MEKKSGELYGLNGLQDLGLSIVIPEIALLFHKHKQPSRLGAALTITEIKLRRDGVSGKCPRY